VSFNGGAGGTAAVPTAQERAAAVEPHVPPTAMQHQHVQEAAKNPALQAKANGGHPAIAATPRPAAFNAPGVVGAHGAAPVNTALHGAPPANGAAHGAAPAPATAMAHPQGQPPATVKPAPKPQAANKAPKQPPKKEGEKEK
jgi:hypothetical protein